MPLCPEEVHSLIVALLCAYEDDGVGADAQLQRDVVVGAEHGQDSVLLSLGAPKLHQQTELICKTVHTQTHTL